jgi:hypothetical protein
MNEGKVTRKDHNKRNDRKRTPGFLAGLKLLIKDNPQMSMFILARNLKMAKSVISEAIKGNLRMKSYALKTRHGSTATHKEKRLVHSKRMLSLLQNFRGSFRTRRTQPSTPKINTNGRRNDRSHCLRPQGRDGKE